MKKRMFAACLVAVLCLAVLMAGCSNNSVESISSTATSSALSPDYLEGADTSEPAEYTLYLPDTFTEDTYDSLTSSHSRFSLKWFVSEYDLSTVTLSTGKVVISIVGLNASGKEVTYKFTFKNGLLSSKSKTLGNSTALGSTTSSKSSSSSESSNVTPYSFHGLRFQVPSSWSKKESDDGDTLYFYPPYKETSMLMVKVAKTEAAFSFEVEAFMDSLINGLAEGSDDYIALSTEKMPICGYAGFKHTYSSTVSHLSVINTLYGVSTGKSTITFSGLISKSADEDTTQAFDKELSNIVNSLDLSDFSTSAQATVDQSVSDIIQKYDDISIDQEQTEGTTLSLKISITSLPGKSNEDYATTFYYNILQFLSEYLALDSYPYYLVTFTAEIDDEPVGYLMMNCAPTYGLFGTTHPVMFDSDIQTAFDKKYDEYMLDIDQKTLKAENEAESNS